MGELRTLTSEGRRIPRVVALRQASREYLEDVRLGLSANTAETYAEDLKAIERTSERLNLPPNPRRWEEQELQAIRRDWMERWVPGTVRRRVSVLNGLLLAVDNPIIENLRRHRRYKLPTVCPTTSKRWPTWEERELLISRASPVMRLFLMLAFELGLRREEICKLRVRDVRRDKLAVHGKGARNAEVNLMGPAARAVDHWLRVVRPGIVAAARARGFEGPEPPELLIHREGVRLRGYAPSTWTNSVAAYAKGLGLTASPHDGRRAFADGVAETSKDIRDVQALMRHSNPATTFAYLQPRRDNLRTVLEVYYARNRTYEGPASKP